jgi:hypothetical protein
VALFVISAENVILIKAKFVADFTRQQNHNLIIANAVVLIRASVQEKNWFWIMILIQIFFVDGYVRDAILVLEDWEIRLRIL